MSGSLILDTSCIKVLRSDDALASLQQHAELIGLQCCPSVINFLEVICHPVPRYRKTLVDVLRKLSEGRPLLPWPADLLRAVARTLNQGEDSFKIQKSDFDRLLQEELTDPVIDDAKAYLNRLETEFTEMYDKARPEIQGYFRKRGEVPPWDDAQDFLDNFWFSPDHIDDYISGLLESFGLKDAGLLDELRQNETWRAYLDAYGISAYERNVVSNQPKRTGLADLLQVTYMTGAYTKILVTRDNAHHRAASSIVDGRYKVARVMLWDDFVSQRA